MVTLNRVVNAIVRLLGLKTFRGADLLYLTTTGRSSGARRTVPLAYSERRTSAGRTLATLSLIHI